jgi:hypothetical protein
MSTSDLWTQAQQTLVGLRMVYGPATDHAAERFGIPFGQWYGWLMAAKIFEPDPVSVARLSVRAAYTNPARLAEHLARGVQLGLLAPVDADGCFLTNAGHAAVRDLISAAYGAMTGRNSLPDADLAQLVGLLRRLVEASLAAPEPPGKWCLRIARHYDPEGRAGLLPQVDQYLSDLAAYRDDAHLAAWRPLGVSGAAWEAFTMLWRGDVETLAGLCDYLCERRGYDCTDYAAALDDLARRGWLRAEGEVYRLTPAGQAVRDEAEERTDSAFYIPWARLNADETATLARLLAGLSEALQ